METMQEVEQDDVSAGWERWRCTAGSCAQELFRVLRRSPGIDVWLIRERPGWVVAAALPVCPRCGTTLRRAT